MNPCQISHMYFPTETFWSEVMKGPITFWFMFSTEAFVQIYPSTNAKIRRDYGSYL